MYGELNHTRYTGCFRNIVIVSYFNNLILVLILKECVEAIQNCVSLCFQLYKCLPLENKRPVTLHMKF